MIHEQGPRADAPFVPVNCGAIPSELMESEFFGHKKGSFTGAVADKEGLFQAASGGTLFLDEVADLPLPMQVKLLRAIQEKAVRPVGSQQESTIDVRILSATHKNLAGEVDAGRFRQDLYYRLNVIELPVPSLRERTDDIPLLANEILARLAEEYGTGAPQIADDAIEALKAYAFPGNVRELENVLERAFTLCENNRIRASDLNLSAARHASVPADRHAGQRRFRCRCHRKRMPACNCRRDVAGGLPRTNRATRDHRSARSHPLEQDRGGEEPRHHVPRVALPPQEARPGISRAPRTAVRARFVR